MGRPQTLDQLPLTELRGIQAKTAEKFARLDLNTIQDLLLHLPLRYQDLTHVQPVDTLLAGTEALVVGEIDQTSITFGRGRSLVVQLHDDSGPLQLRFFHFNNRQQASLGQGQRIRVFGTVRHGRHCLEMVHPHYRLLSPTDPAVTATGLTPIYPATEGVSQTALCRLIDQALERYLPQLAELLPAELLQTLGFPALHQSLQTLHHPAPDAAEALLAGQHPALQRLAFEELLAHHLSLRQLRAKQRQLRAPTADSGSALMEQMVGALSFRFTEAQQRVLREIRTDLQSNSPMQRLVQGDVGSGKTVVAAATALLVIQAGYQVALMAPTELLAKQHYQNFCRWLEPINQPVLLLIGRNSASEKKQLAQRLLEPTPLVAIGTHALFQESVSFGQLGLIIIDEQHRFGVDQRLALQRKSGLVGLTSHQLVLTATPIPRSLAMTFYADMDHSIIDQLPPGREPVDTVVIPDSRRPEVVERIRQRCEEKQQVYWVCPLIDESDLLQAQAATVVEESLRLALPELQVALLHGRMKSAEKTSVMAAFQQGEIDLLVATTVIEVGVDVPNASLMVIENSERLGLAQLHQLRGRVGRGSRKSSCVLLYQPPLSRTARERLAALRETNDGFEIARRDLALRGPGELLGTRQTGAISFRIANLVRDQAQLPRITEAADWLQQHQPHRIQPLIDRWLGTSLEYAGV